MNQQIKEVVEALNALSFSPSAIMGLALILAILVVSKLPSL